MGAFGIWVLTAAAIAAAETPTHIASPEGEVVLAGPSERWLYDNLHFAPARRVGNVIYLSGVVAIPKSGPQAVDFKTAVRGVFTNIQQQLEASGSDLSRVDMLQTFHVWDAPLGGGDRARQFEAFASVKDEFIRAPYPAWTAVGVTSLVVPDGVVEIQVTAHVRER